MHQAMDQFDKQIKFFFLDEMMLFELNAILTHG